MIRTVPGGNAPCGGPLGASSVGKGSAICCASPDRPTSKAVAPTTRTSSSAPRTIHPRRPPVPPSSLISSSCGGAGGTGGSSSGEDWTATPGPAGVATSDQDDPFHQRTSPAAPSG